MRKLLVVFGATGQQGGSVIDSVLNDPVLSKEFKVRGLTRDTTSPASQALEKRGLETVRCDVDDHESIKKAVEGAHIVFAVTVSIYQRDKINHEITQGRAIADAAVAAGVEYLIWSTVPSPKKLSNGKYSNVTMFDTKDTVKDYILTLPIKSSFFAPGSFMQNCASHWLPRPMGDSGIYAFYNAIAPDAKIPLIDIATDTGKFVGAILARPDEFVGKTLCAASGFWTSDEIAGAMGKKAGKSVVYKRVPEKVFKGFLPEGMDVELLEMNLFLGDTGYFGAEQEGLVKWSIEQVKGKLTSLEEYLGRCCPVLE